MQTTENNANFLGTQKIPSLLARLSVPAMVGMFVNALYNFIDTIFVGHAVGPMGIAGLSIAFPIQMLVAAFALMLGVGSASLVSRRLGEKKHEEASNIAASTLTMSFLVALIALILFLLYMRPILSFFGATETIMPYAVEYMQVIVFGFFFLAFAMTSNNLIRAQGRAKIAMKVMIVGTGLNLILDPIFIFALDMGISGAAWATVISQFISFLYIIRFFHSSHNFLSFRLKYFWPKKRIVSEVSMLGMPIFVRNSGMSFLVMITNNLLAVYGGDLAISAFGIINRLLMFFLMPMFGIAQGFQPIAGYNFGARLFSRVKSVLLLSMLLSFLYGFGSLAIIVFFPTQLASLFTKDPDLIRLAARALRIVFAVVPLIGIQVIGSTYYLAIGKKIPSIILGLLRQFILLVPLVLILPQFFQLDGIWYAFPAADFLSALITIIFILLELKNIDQGYPGFKVNPEISGSSYRE